MRMLLMVSFVAVAISGCGGDDGRSNGAIRAVTTTPTTPAHQQFLADADAICADANKKEVALGAQGPGWMYREQFDDPKFLADFNAIGRAALLKLKALTPPETDGKSMEGVIDSITRMVRALDGRITALRAGQKDNSAAHTRPYERAYLDLASTAGSLGLTECQGLLL